MNEQACSQKLSQRTERSKVGGGGCAKGKVPFCRVKTAKPTKLSGREGAGSRGSFPATSTGWCSPPAEKSLHGQGQDILPTSHCKDPPPTPQGRRAGFLSALPPRGWPPHVGDSPRPARASSERPRVRDAAGRVLPRAPTPPQLEAEGRARAGLRDGGAGGAARGAGRGGAGRVAGDSRAKARARGRVRPHHVAAAAAADGSEASWRSTIKRGFSGGREGEESEGGGGEEGGVSSARAEQAAAPPPRSAVRRRGATRPRASRAQNKKKKRAPRRAPARPPGWAPPTPRPARPGPRRRPAAGRTAKMAARAGPRLACSSPEVSSAPSWLELSSFLLTLAAGADMVLLRGRGGSGEGERREGEGGAGSGFPSRHTRGRSLGPAASSRRSFARSLSLPLGSRALPSRPDDEGGAVVGGGRRAGPRPGLLLTKERRRRWRAGGQAARLPHSRSALQLAARSPRAASSSTSSSSRRGAGGRAQARQASRARPAPGRRGSRRLVIG